MHIHLLALGKSAISLLENPKFQILQSLPDSIGNQQLSWEIQVGPKELRSEDLLMLPEQPRLLIIDLETDFNYRDLRLAQSKIFSFIKNNPGSPYLYAPIIAFFEKAPAPNLMQNLRDLITDWVSIDTITEEIIARIIFAIIKKDILKNIGQDSDVIFSLPAKTISFKGESMQLSPTEYALAEIFFNRINETVLLEDLVIFFQSIASSTSMNNIRVVIFHLRMKLAQLTQNTWILGSIYRRGYVLRRAHKSSGSHMDLP